MGSGPWRPRNSAQASGGRGIGDLPPRSLRLEVSVRKGLRGWTSTRTWFETIFCWPVFAGSDVCLGTGVGNFIFLQALLACLFEMALGRVRWESDGDTVEL